MVHRLSVFSTSPLMWVRGLLDIWKEVHLAEQTLTDFVGAVRGSVEKRRRKGYALWRTLEDSVEASGASSSQ